MEAASGNGTKLVVSCVAPAEEGAVVTTRSERIDGFRKTLLELMLSQAPHSPPLMELAEEYGADPDRFEREPSFCIHCGLCVRYCAEVKEKHAVGFIDRGVRKEIAFLDSAGKWWWCYPGDRIDGASIPRFFWRLIGSPFVGTHRTGTALHDCAYIHRQGTQLACDRMMREVCALCGTNAAKNWAMYRAVRRFGKKPYETD